MPLDDFQKFHQRNRQKRRPLGDVTSRYSQDFNIKRPKPSKSMTQTSITNMRHQLDIFRKNPSQSGSESSSNSVNIGQLSSSFLKSQRTDSTSYQPRFYKISQEVLDRLRDTNPLVASSNAHIRGLVNWLKLKSFNFATREPSPSSHAHVENGKSVENNSKLPLYRIILINQMSPYLIAAKVECVKNAESAKTVLLMNSDARITLGKDALVQLLEQSAKPLSINGKSVETYVTWKYVKSP